jgi:hypothetical protein
MGNGQFFLPILLNNLGNNHRKLITRNNITFVKINNTNCYHQAATYEETDVAKQDYIWLRLALFTCNSLL